MVGERARITIVTGCAIWRGVIETSSQFVTVVDGTRMPVVAVDRHAAGALAVRAAIAVGARIAVVARLRVVLMHAPLGGVARVVGALVAVVTRERLAHAHAGHALVVLGAEVAVVAGLAVYLSDELALATNGLDPLARVVGLAGPRVGGLAERRPSVLVRRPAGERLVGAPGRHHRRQQAEKT